MGIDYLTDIREISVSYFFEAQFQYQSEITGFEHS